MPRQNNFLIGQGERLTYEVDVPTSGGQKAPPYDFATQRARLDGRLSQTYEYIRALPMEACPGDRAVAIVTMHPRFVSKSDFPEDLLRSAGLRSIGSRSAEIAPEKWGVRKHPDQASTDQLFVVGTRTSFAQWAEGFRTLTENSRVSGEFRKVEDVSAFEAETKVRSIPADRDSVMLEIVLHNPGDESVVRSFVEYASLFGANVYMEKRRDIGGLTFFPVEVSPSNVVEVAKHSFVRVARGMPSLRPLRPGLTRNSTVNGTFQVALPNGAALDGGAEAVIFDGGIPSSGQALLSSWVSVTDAPGIGPSRPEFEEHGLAVTSAFLFGPLSPVKSPERPFVRVDHVRVLDVNSGRQDPIGYELYDVIERITSHLDQNKGRYSFVNLSIGPDIPVMDDDVSYWTAALDERFTGSKFIPAIAAGNSGLMDAASGLNRLQPPADAINALSVGASDRTAGPWQRADYSSIGPGRTPGLVKPDGVVFGGSQNQPFHVVAPNGWSTPECGTSFAAPLCLRSSAGSWIQLGNRITSLAVRALMVHRAQDEQKSRSEVGWGRFEVDPDLMITCPDDEPLIIYQGTLPAGAHLRAPVPVPDIPLEGMVTITATILIEPRTDPAFAASYTQSGFEAVFRPHDQRFKQHPDGQWSRHPTSSSFFSESAMYGDGEFETRGGLKWEPVVKRSKTFQARTLSNPVFDIYNHSRQPGSTRGTDDSLPYALVISIRAPKVPDLYDQIVRAYAGVLVPMTPNLRLQVTPQI